MIQKLYPSLPCKAVLTSTHNLCFEQKYQTFFRNCLSKNFIFFVVKFSIYLKRRVLVMYCVLHVALHLSRGPAFPAKSHVLQASNYSYQPAQTFCSVRITKHPNFL